MQTFKLKDINDDICKVAVVVPVYKVEKYLANCVHSIINQDYKNLEIVLVDDGSPDECPQICDDLATQYKNIKVIHKENGGLSSARNAGLDLIEDEKVKYVFFLDSDDTIPPGTLNNLVKIAEQDNADIVVPDRYNCVYESSGTEKIRFHFSQEMYETDPKVFAREVLIKKGRAWRAHSLLYKYDLIKENTIRFPIGRISEDIIFNLQFMQYAKRLSIFPDVTVNYLKRSGSISMSYQPGFEEDIWFIDCCAQKFLLDTGLDCKRTKKYTDALLARNIIVYLFRIYSKDTKISLEEKWSQAQKVINHSNSRGVIRKKQETPWFENKKAMYGYCLISYMLRYRLDKIAFYIMRWI